MNTAIAKYSTSFPGKWCSEQTGSSRSNSTTTTSQTGFARSRSSSSCSTEASGRNEATSKEGFLQKPLPLTKEGFFMSSWLIYALLSALSAAFVSIFAKMGLAGLDSSAATAVRGTLSTPADLPPRSTPVGLPASTAA